MPSSYLARYAPWLTTQQRHILLPQLFGSVLDSFLFIFSTDTVGNCAYGPTTHQRLVCLLVHRTATILRPHTTSRSRHSVQQTLNPLKATSAHQNLAQDSQVAFIFSPKRPHFSLNHHILSHPTPSHPSLLIPDNMDQLHSDTFGHEGDAHNNELFSQAQHLLRQCPCRRYNNSASRCVRCKLLLAMFPHRPELQADSPKGGKSRLEIVSSRAPGWSDHFVIGAPPPVELGDDIVAGWSDDDAEDSSYEVDDSSYGRSWEERLVRHRSRDARRQDELDWLQWQDAAARPTEEAKASDPGDVEDEHLQTIGSPNFSSPALQVVWGRFTSYHQRVLQGENIVNLRRAALITFGPSYGRGTAQAVGLWANSDDGSIFFKLGYWIRRQRGRWFGLLFGSWKGGRTGDETPPGLAEISHNTKSKRNKNHHLRVYKPIISHISFGQVALSSCTHPAFLYTRSGICCRQNQPATGRCFHVFHPIMPSAEFCLLKFRR